MIYDPRRRTLELRQRIIRNMSAEELEEYTESHKPPNPAAVTGSGSIAVSPTLGGKPKPPQTYLSVAERMMPGVRALANGSAEARTLVAAHVAECVLKAYLSRDGTEGSATKAHSLGHQLSTLWKEARLDNLAIPDVAPEWFQRFDELHGSPYALRYAEECSGIVMPPAEPMTTDLENLLTLVQRSMGTPGKRSGGA